MGMGEAHVACGKAVTLRSHLWVAHVPNALLASAKLWPNAVIYPPPYTTHFHHHKTLWQSFMSNASLLVRYP